MDHPGTGEALTALRARLQVVRSRIVDCGGDPETVRIVAVTKGRDRHDIGNALAAGLADLGENYAQELLRKVPCHPGARWHFIGNLQSNKVRRLAPHVALWQSVDRYRLLTELARHSPETPILIQVAEHAVPNRAGCEPSEARRLAVEAKALGLRPVGLMCMALPGSPEEVRRQFRGVRRLADELQLPVRSMGTSTDYGPAVIEGANLLRLGTVLFGAPPAAGAVGRGAATGTKLT